MENHCAEMEKMAEEQRPLLGTTVSPKGGFRTLPFIVGTLALVSMATSALAADMIKYLMGEYHMDVVSGSNLIYFWSAISYTMPIIGAILADSLLGRFQVIRIGSVIGLAGMVLLWLPTVTPHAEPLPCGETCSSATTFRIVLLCTAFVLMSIGSGSVYSSLLAFGADQLKHIQKNVSAIESYFSWYYAIASLGQVVGLICLVYIQENIGWEIGYGILVVLMFFAALSFFLGSAFYVRENAKKSLIPGLLQVIVASCRNRHLKFSIGNAEITYHHKSSTLNQPSEKLRFLNKACIIQDPQKDLNSDGTSVDPWKLSTVDQVEELKALLKVIPIWFTGVIMSINFSQSSFSVLQATTLDRHLGLNIEIPAGSIGLFITVFTVVWIALYDRVVLPVTSRIKGKTFHLSTKTRMGFGIFISFWSMVIVAILESFRRSLAIKEGYSDDPNATIQMSILWVVPQYALMGIALGFNAIAQNQFFISEFPPSMSSIASSFYALGYSLASVLASFLMSIINDLSRRDGKESWVSSNINKGHYDYFYWILSGLSILNLLLFFICSRAYGPTKDEKLEPMGKEENP